MFAGFTRRRFSQAFAALIGALAIVTVVAAGPAMAQGSASDLRAQYVDDLETIQSKFIELAGAMEAHMYAWPPMDGVRSVSQVFMVIVAENYFTPQRWGAAPPDGITVSFALFEELAEVTDKREVLDHLEKSSSYMLEAVANVSDEQMHETIQMFGQETTVQASLYRVVVDMHEHLGQAIAYARMNEVVPPWTARQQGGR